MKSHVTCNEIREESFSQLRGEVSALERRRFASHLEHCEACRNAVLEVSDLVETVRSQRFTPAPEQRDRMLEETLTRIKTFRPEGSAFDADKPRRIPNSNSNSNSVRKAVLLAAALLVGFFGTLFFVEKTDPGAQTGGASIAAAENPSEDRDSGFEALRTVRPAAELELGVEEGTRWAFREDDERLFIEVETGTLLIDFHHLESGRDLLVQGPGAEVHVVGTVLMLRANTTEAMEVAVVEGKVKVKGDGRTSILSAGQYRTSQGNIVAMSRLDKELAQIWLEDKDPLEKNIRARENVSKQERQKARHRELAQIKDSELIPMNIRKLYELAESELASGNISSAVKLLEKLIAKSPNSATADTARLDLARLYSGSLGRPEQAEHHLRAYLKRHPAGHKSDLVREMLPQLDTP